MRVLLADDHALVRQCLRMCLESVPHVDIVGEGASGAEVLEVIGALKPDLVVMDISMPGATGIDVTKSIVRDFPQTKVIILSMHDEREVVLAAFRNGASGYVVKSAAYEELVRAIEAVREGDVYVSPRVAGQVIQGLQPDANRQTSLSDRETQVLRAIAAGSHTKAIADDLGISDKTVHAVRARIMRKLNAGSVAELTKHAIRLGLTALD